MRANESEVLLFGGPAAEAFLQSIRVDIMIITMVIIVLLLLLLLVIVLITIITIIKQRWLWY